MGTRFVQSFVQSLAMASVMLPAMVLPASAAPAPEFRPHLNSIIASAPVGYPLRLPTRLLVSNTARFDPDALIVETFASQTPLSVTVSLFTCDSRTTPCLLGTITTDRVGAVHAQQEFDRHRYLGAPITIRRDIRAYVLDGLVQRPRQRFSSVMWKQDEVFYTLSFQAGDRQNLMTMAYSMANSAPLRAPLPAAIPASVPPRGFPPELQPRSTPQR